MRIFVAALVVLACSCNSAPKNSCTAPSSGVVAAATPTSNCNGVCVDGGSAGLVCVVDCTDAGDAVCDLGTSCASGEPFSSKSFCLPTCGVADGGETCPSPLTCNDAGVCTP